MAAIPIVKFELGFVEVIRGSLFDLPAEFFSNAQKAFYASMPTGWHLCPMGYDTFASYDRKGTKFVVPGIVSPKCKRGRRKFPEPNLRFERQQVEQFLAPHLSLSDVVKSHKDRDFRNLAHDLRPLSSQIYHDAIDLKRMLEEPEESYISNRIEDIIAAQQMISMRLDVIDYEFGGATSAKPEDIPVFRKVDKVVRSFRVKMRHKKIRYNFIGKSFATVSGPPIFELIPFLIIENAVKYSPSGSPIDISFFEYTSEVMVLFDSYGPEVKLSEQEAIFKQYYRGSAAIDSSIPGSGEGLFAAKSLLENSFSGSIFFEDMEKDLWYDGEYFKLNRFGIKVPVSGQSPSF